MRHAALWPTPRHSTPRASPEAPPEFTKPNSWSNSQPRVCPADFLDVHVYPEATGPQAFFLASDLLSVEWSVVQPNLPKMPVIMGEFGTYEGTFKDIVIAGALDCFFRVFFPVCLNRFLVQP
jgi:hypothetical protein